MNTETNTTTAPQATRPETFYNELNDIIVNHHGTDDEVSTAFINYVTSHLQSITPELQQKFLDYTVKDFSEMVINRRRKKLTVAHMDYLVHGIETTFNAFFAADT